MIGLEKHISLYCQVLWSVIVVGQEWSVTIPFQVLSLPGSCAVIPCSYTHPRLYTPQDATWYQYSKLPASYPLVYSTTHPLDVIDMFRGRTELLGNVSMGTCSLLISKMTAEDDGEAIYPWIDAVKGFKFYQKVVTLMVAVTATKPLMTVSGEQAEGGSTSVSCEVTHSCPSAPPTLSFGKQRGDVHREQTDEGEGRWRLRATIMFTASATDHGTSVRCNVTHPGRQTAMEEVVLNISYPPRSVNISRHETVVQVGSHVSLTCASDANPPAHYFRWYRLNGGRVTALSQGAETVAVQVLEPDENFFHCTAVNALGQANSSVAHVVVSEYEPVIMSDSSCSYHDGHMQCSCVTWARPVAAVHWTVDGQPQASSFPPTFHPENSTVVETWSAAVGLNTSVMCTANNSHGQDQRLLQVFVIVQAPPTNVSIHQSPVHALEGETVTLSCLAQGYPPVSSYRWYHVLGERGVLLREDTGSLNLTQVTRDTGMFLCTAGNEMGEISSPTLALNVEYAPVILPVSFCSVIEELLRCECVVDSHPVANILWSPRSAQGNQTFNVTSLLNWRILRSVFIGPKGDDSNVLCNATNEHGSNVLKLRLRGKDSTYYLPQIES
ncbi:myelin-associated glycoprotein-like [Aplochiton taeniatus]